MDPYKFYSDEALLHLIKKRNTLLAIANKEVAAVYDSKDKIKLDLRQEVARLDALLVCA